MPRTQPARARKQRTPPRQGDAHQAHAPTSADRYHQERQQILEALEADAEVLRRNRQSFCELLRDAALQDQSLDLRRQRAKQHTQTAKDLRELNQWVGSTAADLRGAILYCLNLAGIFPGPPYEALPFIRDFDRMVTLLTADLSKRRENCLRDANYNRRACTQKPNEWGPATLKAVATIVRTAHDAFGEGNPSNWRRSVKAKQRASYYAGLLWMETGLRPAIKQSNEKQIADVVRKRLDRGKQLRLADEQYSKHSYALPNRVSVRARRFG